MPLVVLDIGHGKNTIGKGVPGLKEHDFNQGVVKYALLLAKLNKLEVLLSQPFDSDEVSLTQRTNLINNSDAVLCISVHADANKNTNAKGHWCFYWHDNIKSKRLAEIWMENADILPNPSRGIVESKLNSWTNFHMTRVPKIPSILIEHGFMTNIDDLKLLKSEIFRMLCAEVIIKTACDFLGMTFRTGDDLMFKDIENHFAKEAIEKLAKNDIIHGFTDGTFKPDSPLTRGEFAKVIHDVLEKLSWYR